MCQSFYSASPTHKHVICFVPPSTVQNDWVVTSTVRNDKAKLLLRSY